MRATKLLAAAILFSAMTLTVATAQQPKAPTENDYYRMVTFPLPDGLVLELSGLGWLDKEQTRLIACTRRGELWLIENPYSDQPALTGQKINVTDAAGKTSQLTATEKQIVSYKQMLFGLHEPLGILVNPGHGFPNGIYLAQRTELTRLEDTDGDDRIDVVETFCNSWEINGNYHEYSFGPKLGKDGNLWINLNRPFGGGQEAQGYWRGWSIKVDNKGKMHPVCPGLRSPAGLGKSLDGEMFFTDNQGDHVASGKMAHLKPGVFHGQPTGLESLDHPLANFKLPFADYPKRGMKWGDAVKANPKLIAPALWFPYPQMGKSQTDILHDTTGGKFGPFAGQTFVGDLSNALVMRVFMEKVDGEYQGACFHFRRNFTPPILRMAWGKGGTMLQWQLGFNLSPQEIAWKRDHHDIYHFMMSTTPAKYQLLIACMLANRELAYSLLAVDPSLITEFDDEDQQLLAKACWETNNQTEVIRLMLDCGFPVGKHSVLMIEGSQKP